MIATDVRYGWCAALVVLSVLVGGVAVAQTPSPEARMMAQTLFEQGRRLMDEGAAEAACVKFEESNQLDPAIGTQFHLADCYALTERLASAWVLFVDVAALARAKDQPLREAAARRRADELEPRLNRMLIEVDKGFEGLSVMRNGTPVGRAQWGTPIPVDAGEHAVTATAQSHHDWRKTVHIQGEGKMVRVRVPALVPLPIPVRPVPVKPKVRPVKPPPPATTGDVSVRSAAALAMGVLGVVALGIGIGAGVVAIDKTSEAEKFCEPEGCRDQGLSLREEARRAAAASTVSFAVGGSALVSGLIIWLTIPDDPTPQGSAFGVTFRGRW